MRNAGGGRQTAAGGRQMITQGEIAEYELQAHVTARTVHGWLTRRESLRSRVLTGEAAEPGRHRLHPDLRQVIPTEAELTELLEHKRKPTDHPRRRRKPGRRTR